MRVFVAKFRIRISAFGKKSRSARSYRTAVPVTGYRLPVADAYFFAYFLSHSRVARRRIPRGEKKQNIRSHVFWFSVYERNAKYSPQYTYGTHL